MEITQIQKNLHNSPRKLRLVADLVRNQNPTQALLTLRFTSNAAASPLSKAIQTALGNAKAQNIDGNNLVFKSLEINEGQKMKRFRAGARGRVKRYVRKMSHIKIVLTDEMKGDK
ncbi:MAG: 50S ribosomal protein L22 [Candidatus Daviesbacteria bacterium]|nr:50S ribosomal protein L22 [Candidatus Daviesbacteria bacterium]